MRIVSHSIPGDNDAAVQRGLGEARRGIACAVAAQLPAEASFGFAGAKPLGVLAKV